jgi:uncharacterized membrane protein
MRYSFKEILLTAIILVVLDLPWLFFTQKYVDRMILSIQGSPLQLNYWAGGVVYLAMAFILLQMKTPQEAFYFGAATYAVYDFTNLATLKNYDPMFAVADTLWGGILFYIAHTVLEKIAAL